MYTDGTGRRLRCENCKRCYIVLRGSSISFRGTGGNSEELHVIPASYQIEDALELSGTKVLMKAGKKMPAVKQFLKEKNCRAVMIENCGMDTEQKYFSAEEIPDQASYYSLIIVKEKRKNRWYILLERALEPRI